MTDSAETTAPPIEAARADTNTGPEANTEKQISLPHKVLRVLIVFVLLYLFLVSVKAMGMSFKLFGKGFARALIEQTANPFIGLFVGVIATSIIQSSSTTTSMVVAFVASGTLSVETAVPVIMGANIGTTVTGLLVSFVHVSRPNEFEKAFAAATVHDFFNLLTVICLLPLELLTGFLSKSARALATFFLGSSNDLAFKGPLAFVVKPVASAGRDLCAPLGCPWNGIVLLVLSVGVLAFSLYFLTRTMKTLVLSKAETSLHKALDSMPIIGIFAGLVITAVIQSSSVTTSLMVPMAAAGILTVEQVFPVALGANVGTTVTALLASLAGNAAGLTIALVHLLFNLVGIVVFYGVPYLRQIPLRLAKFMGAIGAKSPLMAVGYVLILFFGIPGMLIFFWQL
jgi:sodium-dependent phosphate cotransporter